MAIEPLTHCDLNGKVYERLPQVLRQIETALAMDDPSLLRVAQIRDYHDPHGITRNGFFRNNRAAAQATLCCCYGLLATSCKSTIFAEEPNYFTPSD